MSRYTWDTHRDSGNLTPIWGSLIYTAINFGDNVKTSTYPLHPLFNSAFSFCFRYLYIPVVSCFASSSQVLFYLPLLISNNQICTGRIIRDADGNIPDIPITKVLVQFLSKPVPNKNRTLDINSFENVELDMIRQLTKILKINVFQGVISSRMVLTEAQDYDYGQPNCKHDPRNRRTNCPKIPWALFQKGGKSNFGAVKTIALGSVVSPFNFALLRCIDLLELSKESGF